MAKLVLKKDGAVVSEYALTENKFDVGQHSLKLTNGTKTYYAKLDATKPSDVKAIKVSNGATSLYVQKETIPLKTHFDLLTIGLALDTSLDERPQSIPITLSGFKNGKYQLTIRGGKWASFNVTNNTIAINGSHRYHKATDERDRETDAYTVYAINDWTRPAGITLTDYPKEDNRRLQFTADWISN